MLYHILFAVFDQFAGLILRFTGNLGVFAGPFKGMAYIHGAVGSSLVPKIFGTYEKELYGWIDGLPHFQVGLDVGAAEGYYAVGFLNRKTCDRVIAWEMDPKGRALMESLAQANGISDRLEIRGRCDCEELEQTMAAAGDPILLVVDCEGFEGPLIEPLPADQLGKCFLLIETHEPMNHGVHGRLREKLAVTHDILEVYPKRRLSSDIPSRLPGLLKFLALPVLRRLAMSERRCQDLGWLLCRPKEI